MLMSFGLTAPSVSGKLLAQVVESFSHDFLELDLGGVDKLRKCEILGSHLIYSQFLHAVYVAGYDCFQEIFGIYIEWDG